MHLKARLAKAIANEFVDVYIALYILSVRILFANQ
jgi:hypothetical protein